LGFKGSNIGDDDFPPSEDFQGTDEYFPPSEYFQGTKEEDEEFPSSGDFKSSEDDYANVGHSFLSGEFKGNDVDDDFLQVSIFKALMRMMKNFPQVGILKVVKMIMSMMNIFF
jgi:hypothetical protein